MHDHADDWSRWTPAMLSFHVRDAHPNVITAARISVEANAVEGAPELTHAELEELHGFEHRLRCSELLEPGAPDPLGTLGTVRKLPGAFPCGETAVVIVDGRALCVKHGAAALDVSLS